MDVRNFMRLFFFLLCFKTFIAHEPYRASHIRTTSFDTVEKDRALQNHVIEVVHEYSPLYCGFACLQTAHCQSYNIRQETTDLYECELSSSTKTQHPNDFKSVSGVTYYGSDTFHGLGCAVADCPNKNCKETKSYPFYHCQNDAFDLKFPSNATNHTVTGNISTSSDEVSICFWCKTSDHSPFVSYKNNGNPPSVLNLLYAGGFVTLQINNETAYDAVFEIPPIHDDEWHHMCTTWNSSSGHVNIHVDGALRTYPSGNSYFKDEKIIFNGTFKIGHYKYGALEFSYIGKMSQLNIWDYVLPSNELKEIAKNCTMSHAASGNVVKWGRDFSSTQEDSADPRDCSERDTPIKSDSDLHFPGKDLRYSTYQQMPTLDKFTISWWLKTSWVPTAGSQLMAIASFILLTQPQKPLLIAIRGTLEIHFEIAGEQSFHKLPPINDDRWHHMAITWENDSGQWDFFLDGVHRSSIDGFKSGHAVPPSVLVIGQNGDKDNHAGYSSDEELQGSLSRFNIWDKRLSIELIVALAKDAGHDEGNVNSWRNLQTLKYYVNRTEPSTVVSSAGKSNVAFTFIHWTRHNYALIPYGGAEIGQLTVCTWVDLSYTDEWEPCLLSYSSSSTSTDDFYLIFGVNDIEGLAIGVNNKQYEMGDDSALNNKKWRYFCLTWDGGLGEAHWYLEGVKQNSKTDLPKNETLAAQGKWVFTNEQDPHGGGFHGKQSFKKSLAQTNVWNYVLPVKAMKALAYGGTSVEGNLFRWSDIVANYNPGGYFIASPFHLYLPDGVVQKKRDEFCNQLAKDCSNNDSLYARIGPRINFHPPGLQWRCYCKENVGRDKNVKLVNNKLYTQETALLAIV